MLGDKQSMAMVAVKDYEEAKKFYSDTLGLKQIDENPGGVLYGNDRGRIFVYPSPTAGTSQATSINWEVEDIKAIVGALKEKGVTEFEHYEFPGVEYDGEVHIMGDMKAAWFRDPSGNILGLGEATS